MREMFDADDLMRLGYTCVQRCFGHFGVHGVG